MSDRVDVIHEPTGALSDLVVIEVGDEGTQACGKLLADMGATVVKVEPPGGVASRHRGPFRDGASGPENSLHFWAYNTSKESVVLDLDEPSDRRCFLDLAGRADVVLEDLAPGALDQLGLGFDVLSSINPRLVLTSVTPFGQDGPLRDWKGSDLVCWAMGGAMSLVGYGDRSTEPLVPEGEFSYQLAAQWACMGTLAALAARDHTGEGQHVDVSVQEAVGMSTAMYATVPYEYGGVVARRRDADNLVAAADGYVVAQMLNIPDERWSVFRDWLRAEGIGEELHDVPPSEFEAQRPLVLDVVGRIAASRPAAEMYRLGQSFGFTWMAVNGAEQIVHDEQLAARGFFHEVDHPELGTSFRYAGPAAEWSAEPWRIRRRPPLLGEDAHPWLGIIDRSVK